MLKNWPQRRNSRMLRLTTGLGDPCRSSRTKKNPNKARNTLDICGIMEYNFHRRRGRGVLGGFRVILYVRPRRPLRRLVHITVPWPLFYGYFFWKICPGVLRDVGKEILKCVQKPSNLYALRSHEGKVRYAYCMRSRPSILPDRGFFCALNKKGECYPTKGLKNVLDIYKAIGYTYLS